jgi:hypothetical protein
MTTLPVPEVPEWQKPVMFYGKPLTFNPNNHRYYWDGQPVPSVTTIIRRLDKPALIQWAADMAVQHILAKQAELQSGLTVLSALCEEARKAHATIRDAAGDVGNQLHAYAKKRMEGKSVADLTGSITLQAAQAIDAFEKWLREHKIEPLGIERKVMSAKSLYAGTLDFYGRIDGEYALLDFKTGNGVYDEAWFQMGGYDDALAEEWGYTQIFGDAKVPKLAHWIIHLGKNNGQFAAYRRGPEETEAARQVWRSLVQLDKCIRSMPKMPKAKRAA